MNGERDVTERLIGWLRGRGDCRLDPGLSVAELSHAERVLGMTTPPLWRAVLLHTHPVGVPGSGGRYPDWRNPSGKTTRMLVEAPVAGLLFDVAENDFWWHAWGPAPDDPERRSSRARERLGQVPRLTPLVDHLYVGADDDSPVFSIVQGDLHIPALSLAELAELAGTSGAGGELLGAAADADAAEAVVGQDAVPAEDYPIGAVPFWSELHAYSQFGHDDERFAGLARGGL